MYDRLNQRQIVNPHLLTPKALLVLQGKPVHKITQEDEDCLILYCERLEIVDKIVKNIFNHFKV